MTWQDGLFFAWTGLLAVCAVIATYSLLEIVKRLSMILEVTNTMVHETFSLIDRARKDSRSSGSSKPRASK